MKRIISILILILSICQLHAYDINDFIAKCKEMPDAGYQELNQEQFKQIIGQVQQSNSLIPQDKYPKPLISPDSLFSNITEVKAIVFIRKDGQNFFDNNLERYEELQKDIRNIDGYEEYVYSSIGSALDIMPKDDLDSLTVKLNDQQKDEFSRLMKNSFKMSIFGERSAENEFRNPIFLLNLLGVTNIMIMTGTISDDYIGNFVSSMPF